MNWKEFSPTIIFLLKFIGVYMVGSLCYGIFVTMYEPKADPVTIMVTEQSADVLTVLGWPSSTYEYSGKPTVAIVHDKEAIVSVFEGCNGINVIIVFAAFVFSFGKLRKEALWFFPSGLIIIHIANITRIILLFFVSIQLPGYLYFSHKYFFTAFIYAVVVGLWFGWVKLVTKPKYETNKS